ncbi:hypothetical protein VNO77_03107 [Canavalia gladiata]|uniref:Uncharacterized protein n=1 Tax=Canavalia gladiata TaxID=3824 RepID=A0AAN9MW63_CANGL
MAASTSTSLSVVRSGLAFPPHRHLRLHPRATTSAHFPTRLHNKRVFLSSSTRHKDVHDGLSLRRNKPHAWKHIGEPSFFLPQQRCTSCCLAYTNKRRLNLAKFVPGAFLDKSSFQLYRNKLHHSFVNRVQLPHAIVGPDEPHAASTTWPDGIVEKQDLSVYDSELERI